MLDGEKTEKTSGWEVPAKQVEALGEASSSAHPSSSTLPCTSELDQSTVGVPEASKHCNVDEKRFTLKGGVDPQMHMHKGTARQQPPDRRSEGQTAQTGGSANADETEDNSEQRFEERKLEGFIRIVFWQFQQLRMLLGTDLLLFSNGHQGAVSLHLMEVEREVSHSVSLPTCMSLYVILKCLKFIGTITSPSLEAEAEFKKYHIFSSCKYLLLC